MWVWGIGSLQWLLVKRHSCDSWNLFIISPTTVYEWSDIDNAAWWKMSLKYHKHILTWSLQFMTWRCEYSQEELFRPLLQQPLATLPEKISAVLKIPSLTCVYSILYKGLDRDLFVCVAVCTWIAVNLRIYSDKHLFEFHNSLFQPVDSRTDITLRFDDCQSSYLNKHITYPIANPIKLILIC